MRLAAIVFTDIVGFSKLTEGDEVTALKAIESITADPFLSQSRVIPKSLARAIVQ
jgi:hypothetical protein